MPVGLVAPGRRLAYRPGAPRGTYIGKQDGAFREKKAYPIKKIAFPFVSVYDARIDPII